MSVFVSQVPILFPVGRRILPLAACFTWSIFDFFTARPFWRVIFGALGGFALWTLFLSAWPENADQTNNGGD